MNPGQLPTPQIRHRRSDRARDDAAGAPLPTPSAQPGYHDHEGISREHHARTDIARRGAGERRRTGVRKPVRRVPSWLTAAIIVLLMLSLALFTATQLESAYLRRVSDAKWQTYTGIVRNHPLSYQDWITQYAGEYNLQPALVASIILHESSYKPTAESGKGARGLMQLIENTADWINRQYLHVPGYTFQMLWDPETNIQFGCWYLGFLARRYGGDTVTVAAAYNAGHGRVDQWLTDPAVSADGRTLKADAIPYSDTRSYAREVTRDYAIYDALYFHVFNTGDTVITAPGDDADPAAIDR